MKTVTVNDESVTVPNTPSGLDIVRCAMEHGVIPKRNWCLQGHNCNGSNSVIGLSDYPWQEQFTAINIHDNA